jgi:hypothetical protein
MLLDTFVDGNGNLPENKGECRVSDLRSFSINVHHQSLLTFQRAMHLALTCWNERPFWALITTLSSPTVSYFAIWIGKVLLGSSPKIKHRSKIMSDIVLVELEVI